MEVAGQWRREWAGAAEYGKVTEGGVTRQVARAMEVLNASAPGARVRVMRAAYHSSAGPGAPASSYMVHSSRRVISSGTRLLSPSLTSRPFGDTPSLPSLPSLPLEISSTPLELMADTPETENYKVTEPDDTEISQPSKWKSSTGKSSIRMPSEESSSTDNASIIDLDPKPNHKSIFRKYSYDSENSDMSTMKLSSRASPLLDAPVALSTLKYKSLLNGSNEWNNRRKSYSFEETAPLNETISHCNDTLAMESSTDSGICKSTEIVNDHLDYEKKESKYDSQEDSFKDWLNKNRQISFNKSNQFRSNNREHNVVVEEPNENNITLQSAGKVSITVPITLESEEDYQHRKAHANEEADRRRKKVEFCKTELHFAAESGRVNIIATDEKPPPTNDFRRRKSAFMPINKKPERPTTLLLEKKTSDNDSMIDIFQHNTSEMGENDENTAATKSILKNKIPKPKPYLLGENMALGLADNLTNTNNSSIYNDNAEVPAAVSFINRQLQERRHSNDTTSSLASETDITSPLKNFTSRPINTGVPILYGSKCHNVSQQYSSTTEVTDNFNSVKEKLKALQMSPIPARSKTRQLRQSDLTYFGIQNDKKNASDDKPKYIRDRIKMQNEAIDNIFQSVRLIQQVSNSVCNSEAESEDAVEYQNIPLKTNFAPIPTPRSRTKYTDKTNDPEKVTVLKPIVEDSVIIKQNAQDTRRSRSRKYEEVYSPTVRSISEPPKPNRVNSLEKSYRRNHHKQNVSTRINQWETKKEKKDYSEKSADTAKIYLSEEDDSSAPTYVNVNEEILNDNKTRTNEIKRKPEVDLKSRVTHEQTDNHYKETNGNQRVSRERVHKAEKYNSDSLNKKKSSSRKKKIDQKAAVPLDTQHSNDRSLKSQTNVSQQNKCKDENSMATSRESGSLRHSGKNTTEKITERSVMPAQKLDSKETTKPQHTRSSSRHSTSKKDTIENHKRSSANSADRHRNSLQLKTGDRNGEVHYSKDRKSKRNEYVINYDDKNGTVTSITKVSTGPGSTRKKKTSLEKSYTPKEHIQSKPEKNNLLQFPDREIPSGLSYAHKRSKTKVYIQRSCQLL